MTALSILLAEDDHNLGYILQEYLQMHGFRVTLARDGEEAVALFLKSSFDLCILDVMMPKQDGFTAAEQIKRSDEQVPVIFLTAKALKVDKLKGFRLGADDYIVKPVDEEELIARINAIVKRVRKGAHLNEPPTYTLGKYLFDYTNQQLSIGDSKKVMTTKEAEILKALCDCQGNILDRKSVLKELWGESDYFNRRSMDVFVSRLRKYLSQDPAVKIRNVHGKGFVLEVE